MKLPPTRIPGSPELDPPPVCCYLRRNALAGSADFGWTVYTKNLPTEAEAREVMDLIERHCNRLTDERPANPRAVAADVDRRRY